MMQHLLPGRCSVRSASGRWQCRAYGFRPVAVRNRTSMAPSRSVAAAATAAEATSETHLESFSSRDAGEYSIAIMGDLHLEPAQMHLFHAARDHLVAAMSAAPGQVHPGARVVQLGDLGGYKHKPGSRQCFQVADEYLSSFGVPVGLILGNHDLEGDEFEDDAANLAAWQQQFGQHHYWCADLGPALVVGLSTVRFRSNTYSVHEVYVDDAQFAWFEALVVANPQRPILVFTHAPPMGSGLKVVQNVHVKNRCAWLNHSDRPQRYIRLVERHPNIKLWFSGHFHLSQNYADSISVVGQCAFVQTGVIGECNRDGNRQSRLLRLDSQGYQLCTVDHEDAGRVRLDLRHSWSNPTSPEPVTPEEELICDPSSGWLCSQLDCGLGEGEGEAPAGQGAVQWLPAGPNCLLAVQGELLVEYDVETRSPVGLVAFLEGHTVHLETADGGRPVAADGSDAAAVVLQHPTTQELTRLGRNEQGTFFRVFQPNKWRVKKQQEQEALEAPATAAQTVPELQTVAV